jgi:hypothetical protein
MYHQNMEGCWNKPEEFVVVVVGYFMILSVCRVYSIEV